MVLKGFRFGMVLQLAVGPISLFIFQVAITIGMVEGLKGVAGVVLVDGLFIIAAILGLGTLIEQNKKVKVILKYGGGAILFLFGIGTILSTFDINIIPNVRVSLSNQYSVFMKAVIMTLANPLTIVFWAGVFSTKMVEEEMSRQMMYKFGVGAVMSTLIFQSVLTLIGGIMAININPQIFILLNVSVGLFLVYTAAKSVMSH